MRASIVLEKNEICCMTLAPTTCQWSVHKCTCDLLGIPRQEDFRREKRRDATPDTFLLATASNRKLAHSTIQSSQFVNNSIVVGWVQECHCFVISTDGKDPTGTERASIQLDKGH